MSEVPELADAMPGAERALQVAVQRAAEPGPSVDAVVAALARLLEAAGGPDVGNAVRTYLERQAAAPEHVHGQSRDGLLDVALRLHVAADQDVRDALARSGLRAGLAPPDIAPPGPHAPDPHAPDPQPPDPHRPDPQPQDPRHARHAFAARELAARDAAVRAVLQRLRAGG